MLEADLYRSEAKLAALGSSSSGAQSSLPFDSSTAPAGLASSRVAYVRGKDGSVLPEDPEEVPQSKEEGEERWRYEMTMRFIRGEDEDFDYQEVDDYEEWDDVEAREEQEKWFEEESPNEEGGEGNTGVQDF